MVQQKMFEKREFLVRKFDQAAIAMSGVFHSIQFKIAGAQRQSCLTFSSEQDTAAGAQFLETEWLDHEIIGSVIQTPHPGIYFTPCSQNEHRQLRVEGANFSQHLFTVL